MKRWNRLIAPGIMVVIGIVSILLGIYFNLHFGLIVVGNVWIVGAVLMAWRQ